MLNSKHFSLDRHDKGCFCLRQLLNKPAYLPWLVLNVQYDMVSEKQNWYRKIQSHAQYLNQRFHMLLSSVFRSYNHPKGIVNIFFNWIVFWKTGNRLMFIFMFGQGIPWSKENIEKKIKLCRSIHILHCLKKHLYKTLLQQ